jgi:hypothetical protein
MKATENWVVLAITVWSFIAAPACAGIRRVLLSVDELPLPTSESIRAFHIETWGVEFLAVCHLPPSWELKSAKYEDPAGSLDGNADIHGEPLKRLSDMYLLDVYDYQAQPRGDPNGEYHPPSFAGWIEFGASVPFGDQARTRLSLTADNFRLRDAKACPIAPPPQPQQKMDTLFK